ncbi:MAG: ABC transporter permease [Acidimicrobiia bacterium]|nr:ABC transporter permease [Acidimicrobiia bacterium]NNF62817.1 ABC transporter permease [Acidimicrobiia bacterium]
MFAYVIRRLVYGAVTLLALSMVVFWLLQKTGASPLDRLKLNPRIQPDYLASLTERYGLDKSGPEQYWIWLKRFVTPREASIGGLPSILAISAGVAYSVLASRFIKSRQFAVRIAKIGAGVLIWGFVLFTVWNRMNIVLDWGDSFRGDGPVFEDITLAAGASFRLGMTALFLAVMIGIPLGIYQATKQYSFFDQLGTTFSFVAFSTPIFIIGVFLQLGLGLYLERWTGVKLFYVAGMTSSSYESFTTLQRAGDILQHLALPAISIAAISLAGYSRFQRASMLEVLHSDYLRTAKAKGLPRRRVILKHALRNAMIPIVTLISLDIASIIGGAIITESIFGWPGVGRLYIDAINAVDYPAIMAVVMAIGAGIVVMNIVADILYGVLDPRVRYE